MKKLHDFTSKYLNCVKPNIYVQREDYHPKWDLYVSWLKKIDPEGFEKLDQEELYWGIDAFGNVESYIYGWIFGLNAEEWSVSDWYRRIGIHLKDEKGVSDESHVLERSRSIYYQLASVDPNEHLQILDAFKRSKYRLSDVVRQSLIDRDPIIRMTLDLNDDCFRWKSFDVEDKNLKCLSYNEFLNFLNPDEQRIYTLEDLAKGVCAIRNKALSVVFQEDKCSFYPSTHYRASTVSKGWWFTGNPKNLPTQSVKLFLQQIQNKNSPTHSSSGQNTSENTNKKQTILEQITNFDYSKVLEDSIPTTLPKQFYLNITDITDEEVKNKYITWLWKNNITDCDYEYVKDHVYFGLDYDDVAYSSFRNLWGGEFVEITIEDWLKFEGYKLEI